MTRTKTPLEEPSPQPPAVPAETLAHEIGALIEAARHHVAQTANAALTMLYWQIGARVRQDILGDGRARPGTTDPAHLCRLPSSGCPASTKHEGPWHKN